MTAALARLADAICRALCAMPATVAALFIIGTTFAVVLAIASLRWHDALPPLYAAGYEEIEPICDHCDEPDGPGEADWNGETGNHLTCEAYH
jgi:hypothetical protein